jgi:hypothetical protein
MRRLHTLLVISSFLAVLAAPAIAHAQPGDRPATQLFLAPTGRALPKGQGYFKAVGLAMPSWQGGVTDRLSVGVIMPVFVLGRAVVLTPKFQIQRSATHSTSIGTINVVTTFGSGNVAYLAHTIERKTGAFHVTVMKPMSMLADPGATVIMFGAEHRVNARVTVMTENYVVGGSRPMISGGIRYRGNHETCDFGLLVPPTFKYGARPTPMITVGYKF